MPKSTQEFARFWRAPELTDELRAQNDQLSTMLESVKRDLARAQEVARQLVEQTMTPDATTDNIPSEIPALTAQNILLRVNLLQLLTYFEGVNAINEVAGSPLHNFTLTPQDILGALER